LIQAASAILKTTVASVPPDLAARVATTDCSILLTGETGSGKGHLARWLHDHSTRSARPFIPVNGGAIPEGIIDSHLFGHVRGSFSDATQDHIGLVRAAEGGTLFLDEVAELPMSAQVRLLRLLEEREAQPVGSARPVAVNVRIIAATGSDLLTLVDRGVFRRDLFFRLNVIHFDLKPLRARVSEITALVDEINEELASKFGRKPLRFEGEARRALQRHRWPGNVRELRSVIERLYVLCPNPVVGVNDLRVCGQLDLAHRPPVAPAGIPSARPAFDATGRPGAGGASRLREARAAHIRRTLDVCGGNVTLAATTLGVHRSTVHRWLKQPAMV